MEHFTDDGMPEPSEDYQRAHPDWNKNPADALRDFLNIGAWTEREIPPADRLLGDLVTTTTRIFVVGRTGLGKTLLGLGMAVGMATGAGFLHWRSSRPARVLVVDGEMPCELIRARAIDAMRRPSAMTKR